MAKSFSKQYLHVTKQDLDPDVDFQDVIKDTPENIIIPFRCDGYGVTKAYWTLVLDKTTKSISRPQVYGYVKTEDKFICITTLYNRFYKRKKSKKHG